MLKNNHTHYEQNSRRVEYLPFGEILVEEHLNSNNSPFRFNAKELDEETGNYYYGARYYDPKWSIWISVDPLAEQMPEWSSYAYTFNNPVNFTDPTGMIGEGVNGTEDYYKDAKGNIIYDESINSEEEFENSGIVGEYLGKTHKEDDTYFGLFGEISDLNTLEGKLAERIDQTIINYAKYYNGEGYERSVDFNLGIKFKSGFLSSASDNLREFDYNGAKGYYHIFGSKDAMHGILNRGSGNYSKNSNYGLLSLRNGWNVSIYNTKSARTNPNKPFNIINLVFPTQESYNNFDRSIDYEFFGKENPSPIKKTVLKTILD